MALFGGISNLLSQVVQPAVTAAPTPDYSSLVSQAYQTVLGRAPEAEGLGYWSGQLASGALTPQNIYENIAYAAQGADQANAAKYAANLAASQATPQYTSQDIQGYLQANPGMTDAQPEVQSRYQTAIGQNQDYSDLVSQAYAGIGRTGFGSEMSQIDPEGYKYWTSQLQSGALTPETFGGAFQGAVTGYMQQRPEDAYTQYVTDYLVNKAYQDVLGRAPEQEGEEYWKQQLISGAVGLPSLFEAIAYGSQGLDRIAAQKYLGKEYWAPEEYLKGTSGFGYQDIVDYIAANVNDPVRIYQAAQEYGIDPQEIIQAKRAVGMVDPALAKEIQDYLTSGSPTVAGLESLYNRALPTVQQIEDYFAQGKAGYGERFGNILNTYLGSPEEQAQLELLLKQQARNPNATLAQLFDPTKYSSMSIENIEKEIEKSPLNKFQESMRLSNIMQRMFGYDEAKAQEVIQKAYTGKLDKNTIEGQLFDTLLKTNTLTPDSLNQALTTVADKNPNDPYFKANPDLLTIYKPIKEIQRTESFQPSAYGTINGLPVLNAKVAEDLFNRTGPVRGAAGGLYNDIANTAKDLGTNFQSWSESTQFLKGPSIFGIDFDRDFVKDSIDFNNAINSGNIQVSYDSETGAPTYTAVEKNPNAGKWNSQTGEIEPEFIYTAINPPQTSQQKRLGFFGSGGEDTRTIQRKLNEVAPKLGIDPAGKDLVTLYDEVAAKTDGLYQIVGSAAGAGLMDNAAVNPENRNHFSALYREMGDKLIPVQANFFDFSPPKKKKFAGVIGGDLGDMLSGIASIPFVAEIAAFIPGVGLPGYAAIKGAQAATATGNLLDGVKVAGITYFAPKVTSGIASVVGEKLVNQGVSKAIADGVSKAVANAATSGGIAALMGGDIGDAALNGLYGSVVSSAVGEIPFLETIPEDYRPVVARALTEVALGKDLQDAINRALLSSGGKLMKQTMKEAKTASKESA